METKFNFNSSVCTSIEQSRKLLALGLKKETRDVVLKKYIHNGKYCYKPIFEDIDDRLIDCDDLYPAWSLHRLFQIYTNRVISSSWNMAKFNWDDLIDCIEDSIVKGHLNKEYLEE